MKTPFQDLPAVEQKHLQALQEPFPFAPSDGNVEMALSALREKARQQIQLNQACEYHTPWFFVVYFPTEDEILDQKRIVSDRIRVCFGPNGV